MKRIPAFLLFPISMRGVLLLLVSAVLLPLLLVQAGILTAWYYSRLDEQKMATLDTAGEAAATFEAYLLDVHRQELAIGATLTGPHPYTTEETNEYLTSAGQGYPSIRCWSWADPKGKIIASSQPKAIGSICSEDSYFQTLHDSRDDNSWAISDHRIDPIDGRHVFVIASRINDSKGAMSGVVIATVEVSELAKRAIELYHSVGEAVALFDRRGILVYNSQQQNKVFQDWKTIDPFLADALRKGTKQLGILALATDGESVENSIVARVPIGNIGWVAGERRPVKQAMASVTTGLWVAGCLNLLVAISAGLLALTIGGRLIGQLRRLQAHAKAIGQGDFSHSSDAVGVNELAELTTDFNKMGTEVRNVQEAMEAINATLEQRVHERTAELAATVQALEKTDEELRATSRYARGLIEASLDPLVTISPEGIITDVNEATAAALGIPREQLIGRDFADYFTEPDKARDGYRIVLAQGLVRDYALTIRHASGSEMDVLYNAVVYRNESGEVQGVFAAARDVTERRRMERELDKYRVHLEELVQQRTQQLEDINKQLEKEIAERKLAAKEIERLASFPMLNPNPLSELDLEGRLHYINPAAERLFPDLHDLGTDHPWLKGWETAAAALRGGDERVGTREVVVGDRCFQQTIHFVDQIERIRIYGLDITLRKQAELEIQEREEELSAIYENAPLVMLLVDQDRRITKANRLAGQFAGSSTDGLLALRGGEALRCVHSLDDPQGCGFGPSCQQCMVRRTIAQTIETGKSQNQVEVGLSCNVQGVSQNFTFLLSTARLAIRGEPHVLVTIQDISDRKRAEEALKRTAEQLELSNQELEQFAYVASHDLQEPLRVVNGYVQLIERKFKDNLDEDAKQFIFYIVDGVERMRQLITDLLNYSRVGSRGMEFRPTSVQAVLDRVSENLKRVIEESGAEIAYSSMPEIKADETQMIQLFQNLIGNGIKFRGERPPRIEITANREGDHWVFAVRDNGIGIDRQYWDQIFVIFQRLHTRQKYPGTGIGLAICKRIVERHGGRIWLDSQPGQGTTFYFTLS